MRWQTVAQLSRRKAGELPSAPQLLRMHVHAAISPHNTCFRHKSQQEAWRTCAEIALRCVCDRSGRHARLTSASGRDDAAVAGSLP